VGAGESWGTGPALFIVPGGTPGLEMVRKLDKLGQEKLEHKLAGAREVIEGGRHSGSATMGSFEQTRPMVADQALGIARAAMNTRPSTRTAAKRSGTDHPPPVCRSERGGDRCRS
jgi:alkylation response protein AidB-like acyl-CoA dehydrogenase